VSSINQESRRYPTRPFLGVGALIFEGREILLVERAKEPLKGYWSLPGGVVEAGENWKTPRMIAILQHALRGILPR
jgi:NUDIX domain